MGSNDGEGFAIENESLTNTAESIGKNIEDIALDFNTFTILGGNTDWTIERPEWVILSKTDGQGPSSINISIDPQYADYGINNGSIIVYDSVSRENFGFEINYELKHADVTIDTEPHTFSVNNMKYTLFVLCGLKISVLDAEQTTKVS